MKVNPKYLEYKSLPSAKPKKKTKANQGFYMDPGPRYPMPGLPGSVSDYYGGRPESDLPYSPIQGPAQIGSINTDLVKPGPMLTPRDLRPPGEEGQGPNWGNAALLGLAAADALIPGYKRRQNVVQPQQGYNPYPYGTGSQALEYGGDISYARGGTLSPAKAKEMLRDGTANGKKLTKKQKQYFGMVAAGKAALGDVLSGDPTKPLLKRPIKEVEQFRGEAGIQGTNAFTENQFAMDHTDKRMTYGIDLVNSIVSSGMLPHETTYGKDARRNLEPQMLNYLYQFNQRQDLKGMTPEQRVRTFYDIPSGDESIQAMKDNMRRYGYGPLEFRRGQVLGQAQPLPAPGTVSTMRSGGVLYNDGGQIDTMWGGSANMESYNPYDGGMVGFAGASHDNGGIGMAYNGNPVEVEGGEFASRDPEGNLSIYGNMTIPGTKTKFKSVAKKMAKVENRYDFLKSRGAELVENSNPADKYEALSFNAGKVMMEGGTLGQKDIAGKKSRLSALQRAMLDTASEFGLDPQSFSEGKTKKAKGGASIPFMANGGDPKPTMGDRNNNPGNIKWGEFARKQGAKKGPPAPDGGFWAVFPSRDKGLNAMESLLKSGNYKNLDVDSAIRKWTGGNPYRYDLSSLKGRKISDLNKDEFSNLMNTMVQGEGTTYGVTPRTPPRATPTAPQPRIADPGPFTPYSIPKMSLTPVDPIIPPGTVEPPPIGNIPIPEDRVPPSNVEPLHANQLLGEIYAAATNKVEPVPAQRFEPQLFSPYQISLQDRLNANQSTFNAQARDVGGSNPSALGVLGAQKYAADSAVKADEFRTNQAIASDITNRNIGLVNDAQLRNLAIADQQMVRQSQARSNTKALTQSLLNSASSKYAQNDLENRRLALYENLYDYRFVPTDDGGLRAQYFGPNAMFNFDGRNATQATDVRTVSRYDRYGNLKGYTNYDDYDTREQERLLDIERKKRQLPLMQVPKLQ